VKKNEASEESGGPATNLDGPQRGLLCLSRNAKCPIWFHERSIGFVGKPVRRGLSGMALLILVYYIGGGALVDADVSGISVGAAIGLGVGVLLVGWIVYDLLMLSPLGKNEKVLRSLLTFSLSWSLTPHASSEWAGRLHSPGAMFGTIMAANVWMRILPAQRKMITAINEGKKPDDALSARQNCAQNRILSWLVP